MLTTTFSVIGPNAPHRVLRSCVEAVTRTEDDGVGEIELPSGARVAVPRLAPPSPGRRTIGKIEVMALHAGQSVGAVHRVERAGDVVRELAAGVDNLLAQLSRLGGRSQCRIATNSLRRRTGLLTGASSPARGKAAASELARCCLAL